MAQLEKIFNLRNKVVMVTGASSGIGEHASMLFAESGCRVVLAARRLARVERLAARLQEQGHSAIAVELDVNDRASVQQAVASAVTSYGAIDVLLNNAGIAKTVRFVDMTEQDWQQVVDTNLNGVWRVGQAVARQMLQQETSGNIVNIASILGQAVQKQQANYAASKSAVIQLTRSMALELGPRGDRPGIRCNAIAPGYIVTEINQDFFAGERGQQYLERLFPKRAGQLEELDGALLLLASDAGSYINGSVITVDGGTLLAGV